MPPKLSSPLWEHLERLQGVKYSGTIVYARCIKCTTRLTNGERAEILGMLRSEDSVAQKVGCAGVSLRGHNDRTSLL
jgi:hypothetical protein